MLIELLSAFNFKALLTSPTYKVRDYVSLLDNVFTNTDLIDSAVVKYNGISDHIGIILLCKQILARLQHYLTRLCKEGT